ncbi:hypothetical protein M9980_06530 [Sphingomonas donggukensis]|uniref:LysR family transcriptional regulator n=1 Tax=Sphingomonas donggukensis TaxID=2949093 RepID=A0ABY4TWQ4_9SPHN|nr:hypothetical protein [Sphingomonas donggukensis]URW76845.1 hypothetical protein M9980_06530 [Sphingomonas donggukensis]
MDDSVAADDELLGFVPVPTTARRDGWTPDRQRLFIAILAEHGCVSAAARAAGMTPQSARRLRNRPDASAFVRSWTIARQMGRDRAYDEAVRRGRGVTVPVTYAGRVIGHRTRLDNRLLFAACYGSFLDR